MYLKTANAEALTRWHSCLVMTYTVTTCRGVRSRRAIETELRRSAAFPRWARGVVFTWCVSIFIILAAFA